MITSVSHITLAADDPDRAAADYQLVLGQHARRLTGGDGQSMMRFQLNNIALEIVAADGRQPGLRSLAFEVTDMTAATRKLGRRGIGCEATSAELWTDEDGRLIRRKTTELPPSATAGVPIRLIENLQLERSAAAPPQQASVTSIDHIVVQSGHPERAIAFYGARLGLDFTLDRTSLEWGLRLLFFLCGGVRIEISHCLAGGFSDDPDLLSGLAWQVGDAALAQQRLRQSGVQTSDVRKGRRPGSQVLTLRSNTCDVPTLFLSETPRPEAVA